MPKKIDYADLSNGWIRLDSIQLLPDNAKEHDIGALIAAFQEFGFFDPIGINQETGHVFRGNGRTMALRSMKAAGLHPPKGIKVDPSDEMWMVPYTHGIAFDPETEHKAALAANRVHDRGGYNHLTLARVLSNLAVHDREHGLTGTGYDNDDLDRIISLAAQDAKQLEEPTAPEDFKEYDEDSISTEYTCPRCEYSWSGKPK